MALEKAQQKQNIAGFGAHSSGNRALQALSPGNRIADVDIMAKCRRRSGNQHNCAKAARTAIFQDWQAAEALSATICYAINFSVKF